jgi:hypothetical protein
MLSPGDLVLVKSTNTDDKLDHGVVLDYRPNVYGGSSILSYRTKGGWEQSIEKSPRRGEVLVRSYVDGDVSWYDELCVRPFDGVVE